MVSASSPSPSPISRQMLACEQSIVRLRPLVHDLCLQGCISGRLTSLVARRVEAAGNARDLPLG